MREKGGRRKRGEWCKNLQRRRPAVYEDSPAPRFSAHGPWMSPARDWTLQLRVSPSPWTLARSLMLTRVRIPACYCSAGLVFRPSHPSTVFVPWTAAPIDDFSRPSLVEEPRYT
ncbi:hypothetical protein M011DRAFT_139160 [Sporormia fimetaria CBS 119925]|uniref:Uncharacterized protein n=1 Tax=Sporormia fimetaria CBS 119925 TaxID=1340428 RepID=A0A6A6V669_9PLEO|nr:hypothetical protein M011DRAFT_139160 [Sporormia fimetaria CBS 119925]